MHVLLQRLPLFVASGCQPPSPRWFDRSEREAKVKELAKVGSLRLSHLDLLGRIGSESEIGSNVVECLDDGKLDFVESLLRFIFDG